MPDSKDTCPTKCPICYDPILSRPWGVTSACGHPYHKDCWDEYISSECCAQHHGLDSDDTPLRVPCPVCKSDATGRLVRVYVDFGGISNSDDIRPNRNRDCHSSLKIVEKKIDKLITGCKLLRRTNQKLHIENTKLKCSNECLKEEAEVLKEILGDVISERDDMEEKCSKFNEEQKKMRSMFYKLKEEFEEFKLNTKRPRGRLRRQSEGVSARG